MSGCDQYVDNVPALSLRLVSAVSGEVVWGFSGLECWDAGRRTMSLPPAPSSVAP